jgi:hypothetical protein
MCYKAPGPRCSAHALSAFIRAEAVWERVSMLSSSTDEEKMRAMETMQHAQEQYDMTPAGWRELESAIAMLSGDRKKKYEDRLAAGKAKRAFALESIRYDDKGDINDHTEIENMIDGIPSNEGFPREQIVAYIHKAVQQFGQPLGVGRNRIVFDRKDGTVVKVPSNWDGFMDNGREAAWEDAEIPIASCSIQDIGEEERTSFPVLIMEKVKPLNDLSNAPQWVGFVDCGQVGHTTDGKLVAYDL